MLLVILQFWGKWGQQVKGQSSDQTELVKKAEAYHHFAVSVGVQQQIIIECYSLCKRTAERPCFLSFKDRRQIIVTTVVE